MGFKGKWMQLIYIPFKGALSSSSLPKEMRRMYVGLDGFASHSATRSKWMVRGDVDQGFYEPSLHSRKINSFSLYTLRLKGSFPCTSTFRLLKYLLSSLKGWRAPVVRRRVIIRTGPVSSASFVTGIG